MPDEVIKLLQSNQQEVESLNKRNKELEDMLVDLQQQILRLTMQQGSGKSQELGTTSTESCACASTNKSCACASTNKSCPEIVISI
jgi:hypothetical protein